MTNTIPHYPFQTILNCKQSCAEDSEIEVISLHTNFFDKENSIIHKFRDDNEEGYETSSRCTISETDSETVLEKELNNALLASLHGKAAPPVQDLSLRNNSMSDKSELTMDSAIEKFKNVELDLVDTLKAAMKSRMFKGNRSKGNMPIDPSSSTEVARISPLDAPSETKKEGNKMPKNNLTIQVGSIRSVDDTATMTTISEDSSPVHNANILTTKSSNVSLHKIENCFVSNCYAKEYAEGEFASYSSSSTTGSTKCTSDDETVTENFRFERLHSYGRKQLQVRRELAVIQEIEKSKREIKFQFRLEERQKREKKKAAPLPAIELRGRRIHDRYSSRKNEEGKKLREAIARRNEKRAQFRIVDMKA